MDESRNLCFEIPFCICLIMSILKKYIEQIKSILICMYIYIYIIICVCDLCVKSWLKTIEHCMCVQRSPSRPFNQHRSTNEFRPIYFANRIIQEKQTPSHKSRSLIRFCVLCTRRLLAFSSWCGTAMDPLEGFGATCAVPSCGLFENEAGREIICWLWNNPFEGTSFDGFWNAECGTGESEPWDRKESQTFFNLQQKYTNHLVSDAKYLTLITKTIIWATKLGPIEASKNFFLKIS